MGDELERVVILTETWATTRIATLYELVLSDGRIKFNVQVKDEGRLRPYIDQMFKYEEQARDFLYNKLMKKEVKD